MQVYRFNLDFANECGDGAGGAARRCAAATRFWRITYYDIRIRVPDHVDVCYVTSLQYLGEIKPLLSY